MLLLLSVGNVLTGGFQLSAQEQSKRFSVKVDNITLKEAIEVIKKQGNYSFLIRNNDIDLNRKVSVNINNGTINDVMGQLLAGTDVSYEVNGTRVIMFHAVTPQKEQEKAFVLKGRITDPTGEGVIGANVKVVDSTEGTITDMDGNFSLMVTFFDGYSECPFIHIVYRLCHTGSGGERSTSSQCNFERRYSVNRRSSSCWLRRTKESEPDRCGEQCEDG